MILNDKRKLYSFKLKLILQSQSQHVKWHSLRHHQMKAMSQIVMEMTFNQRQTPLNKVKAFEKTKRLDLMNSKSIQ